MSSRTNTTTSDADVLWRPGAAQREAANLTSFMRWLDARGTGRFEGYDDLWRWSVTDLENFWQSVWDYYEVQASETADTVLADAEMPGARWFPGARLNWAENLLRRATPEHPALIWVREGGASEQVTWAELARQVAALALTLRRSGVGVGDRVVAYLSNSPASVVGVLACASIGAVWAACAPDFGSQGVLERFGQLEPSVLLAVDGYRFGGKDHDRLAQIGELVEAMPSIKTTIVVRDLRPDAPLPDVRGVLAWEAATIGDHESEFEQVAFDHPLWILFSSGTTGRPKGIVQGHGGILLEHLKVTGLMNDVRAGDRVLFMSSTTWMVWNILVASLLVGATAVLYDGNPVYPGADALWAVAEREQATLLGVGAGYIHACQKAGLEPRAHYDLSSLRCVLTTGSPLSPDGYDWVYDYVGDLWLSCPSGGTDVCSSFLGACSLLPVVRGRLQPPALGVAAAAFDDDGVEVVATRGELVITAPMPSMPVGFWDDDDGARYRAAYFDRYPGVWRHGDFIEFAADGYSVISGRSDSTLNRRGVRMGSAEIYAAVESLPDVAESLVVGVELAGGEYYMPLFVAPVEGRTLDDELRAAVIAVIRRSLSPRHLPDDVIGVSGIPHTKTAKKLEVPIKRLYQGVALGDALDLGSVDDPALLVEYGARAAEWLRRRSA